MAGTGAAILDIVVRADAWYTNRIEGVEVSDTGEPYWTHPRTTLLWSQTERELNMSCSSQFYFGFSVTHGQI